MTHQCIIIQVHFAIHRDDLIIRSLEQRVDLEHGAIQSHVCIIKISHKLHHVLERITFQSQVESDLARLVTL